MDILGVAGATFGLIPALVKTGKFSECEQAVMTLLPHADDLKDFTPDTVLKLHDAGTLVPIAGAVNDLAGVVDAILTEDSTMGSHVQTLLGALGLGKAAGG